LFLQAWLCKFIEVVDLPPALAPDDVLAQPTRARLFALLSELRRPGETVELAERLRLHPNGVRVHLERLESAGLVVRERTPQARGRPRDAWTVASGARPGGQAPHAYADLGRWLARATPARPRVLRDVQAAGREIGRELASRNEPIDGRDALQGALTALGFEPQLTQRDDDRMTLCLGNCPYRDAVHENQAVICTLHRGITIGLLDVLDRDATLTEFVPHDPDTAGCTIEISQSAAGAVHG
jgi:predicted ArsR family transcriptional regulator